VHDKVASPSVGSPVLATGAVAVEDYELVTLVPGQNVLDPPRYALGLGPFLEDHPVVFTVENIVANPLDVIVLLSWD
jgi:hypothetical protein